MITFLGLGSNLGNREENIRKAIELLKEKLVVEKQSLLYETNPVGFTAQNKFINAVVKCKTNLSPNELLLFCQSVEQQLGRVRAIHNGPRTVDVDILLCDNLVVNEPGLILPHLRLHERDFVLKPFLDVEDVTHPLLNKKISVLRKELRIKELWTELLSLFGDNPLREGLKDTPSRVAAMFSELLCGYDTNSKPKITVFPNGADGLTYNQLIIDEGTFCSFCEHHCLPFFGRYWFGYIPQQNGNIVGLSKIARVVRFHASRLQVQERLVREVIDDVWNSLSKNSIAPKGMALVLKAKHLCKCIRGVRQDGEMTTIELRGLLKEDARTRQEFLSFVHGGSCHG